MSLSKYKQIVVPIAILLFWTVYVLVINPVRLNDDIWFYDRYEDFYQYNLINYLSDRFSGWTSRLFIEIVLVLTVRVMFLWKLLFIVSLWLCTVLPAKIIYGRYTMESCCLMMIIMISLPLSVFSDAGWVATTTNYIIPFSIFLIVLYFYIQWWREEKFSKVFYIFTIFLTLYAANQEQIAASMLGLWLVWCLLSWIVKKNKSNILYSLPHLVMVIVNFCLILLTPGNKIRSIQEINTFFPDYNTFSPYLKLRMGVLSTLQDTFLTLNVTILIFYLSLLFLSIFARKRISIFLTSSILVIILFLQNNSSFSIEVRTLAQESIVRSNGYYVQFFIYMLIIVSSLYIFYDLLNKNILDWLVSVIIIGLGFSTRFMLGFSPTLFASGLRTYLILYMSLGFLSIYLIRKVMENNEVSKSKPT